MSPEWSGACALALMACVFQVLQEEWPLAEIASMPSLRHAIQTLDRWLAGKFNTPIQWASRIEIGALSGMGFTSMQIAEYFVSVVCWVLLGFLLFARALVWEGIGQRKGLSAVLKLFAASGAILLCALCISVTALKKSDDEPWSNLQKWGRHKSPFSIRISSLIMNGVFPVWGTGSIMRHSVTEGYDRYRCEVPTMAQIYLTNNQTHWTIVANLHVEALDDDGEWAPLGIINSSSISPLFVNSDLRHVIQWEPADGKYFDQQIAGKNIAPGETASGMLLLLHSKRHHLSGSVKIVVTDINGNKYAIGPINTKGAVLPPGGLKTGATYADLSQFQQRECPLWGWE